MAEQRLIDANNLGIGMAYQSEFYPNYFAIGWNSALKAVTEISPTIDPETLPIVRQLREELERVTAERDAAIKEIFQWTGCPACKHWDSADNWCNKHDRSADSCDGCSTPEWHGLHKEE